jgi:integrase
VPRGLTTKAIENLKKRDSRYEVPDPGCPGLYLAIHPTGAKSWTFRYRLGGRPAKLTIGGAYDATGIEVIKLADARDLANEARVAVARQINPAAEKKVARQRKAAEETVKAVADEYLKRHAHLRTIEHRRAFVFEKLIFPAFGDRPINSIKRKQDIVRLLDRVEDQNGAVMADYVLAVLRHFFNWHAGRSDDFNNPIVRGMARTKPRQRQRQRTLTEPEIKALWKAADASGSIFGRYLQFLLLTATRRNEAARMRRSEVVGGDWIIPPERYKNGLQLVIPLSAAAIALLVEMPKIARSDLIFTSDGKRPIGGFSKAKAAFDKLMLAQIRKIDPEAELVSWTIHDLRRTARTLMSQAGVRSDHAERCLGHVIPGVGGTYDRHAYHTEKKAAFEALAHLIERIVNPAKNVLEFSAAKS